MVWSCDACRARDVNVRKRARTACVSCRRRKLRCDGGFPCKQCVRFSCTCARDGLDELKATQNATCAAPLPVPSALPAHEHASAPAPSLVEPKRQQQQRVLSPLMSRELSFNGVRFGSREMHFMNMYMQCVHPSLPAVPATVLRDGVNATGDAPLVHAVRAVSWAAIALGASFSDVDLALDYMGAAIRNMRQCFEVPREESVMAYTMIGITCHQLGKQDLFSRYVKFAGVIEETLPSMSPNARNTLMLSQAIALNRTPSNDTHAVLPSLEEIRNMDIRFQVIFVNQLCSHRVRQTVFDHEIPKEEKVRVCQEAINLVTPILEQLESDPRCSRSAVSKLATYLPLIYFWAVCGDRSKALGYCTRLLDILEENLHFLAFPNLIHIRSMATFLGKLGSPELQHRLEQICRAGAKHVICTPAISTSKDHNLRCHLENLVDEAQEQQPAPQVHIPTPLHFGVQDLEKSPEIWPCDSDCCEFLEVLDRLRDGN